MKTCRHGLPFRDALRVKSAELWLQLGQPTEALKELKAVSATARQNPWASRVLLSAIQRYCTRPTTPTRS